MNRWLAVLFSVIAIAAAACSNGDNGADDHRYRGFYGGLSGGVTTP